MRKKIGFIVLLLILLIFSNSFAETSTDAFNKGMEFVKQGKYSEAISKFNQAISMNPNYAEAYGERAAVYSKKGDLNRAIADFYEAYAISPVGYYLSEIIKIYEKNGKHELATAIANEIPPRIGTE